MIMKNTFREDVEKAVAFHGHLCSGQCIGVKMARLGLELLGPEVEADRHRLFVFVECDRCPADAIMAVTGAHVGKRTMKVKDFGKIAATFADAETGRAFRILRENRRYPAEGEDMVSFYESLPDEEIFRVQKVSVDLRPCDKPGKPVEARICEKCGEEVTDSRHVEKDGAILCKACAGEAYYTVLE